MKAASGKFGYTGILAAATPIGRCLVHFAPHVWQARQVIQHKTGWSIVDPVEPLLALAFLYCVISWLLSWVHLMEFVGFFVTIALGAAVFRIRLLGTLKEQLDRFAAENDHFRTANKELKQGVDQLHSQNDRLQASNKDLEASIQGLDEVREAMVKYASETQGDLGDVLSQLHESIGEQKRIQQQTLDIEEETKRLAVGQERAMLMGLFMQFQDQDGEQGLSRDELETLVDMLPEGSGNKVRAHLGDFSEMDADGDGVVSMANFRDFVRRVGEDLDNTSQTGGLGG